MIDAAPILVAHTKDLETLKRAFREAKVHNPLEHLPDGTGIIHHLESGEKLATSESGCPLLVIIDLQGSAPDGFESINALREHPRFRDLPTIVFINSDQPTYLELSLGLRSHAYWVKPSRFEDLVRMIVRLKDILSRVEQKVAKDFPLAAAA